MEVAAHLKGHKSAVCAVSTSGHLLASGGEDGLLCVHDLETQQVRNRWDLSAVASSSRPPSAATKQLSGPTEASCNGADEPAAVAAVCFSPCTPGGPLYVAAGPVACMVDPRAKSAVQQTYSFCKDEVGDLAVHAKGTFLALGDDTGAVQVVDLATGKLFKSMRQAHSNICSSVAFRRHRPWELLSGGLDMTVARWDFSKAKALNRWTFGSGSGSSGDPSDHQEGPQLFNPPMVRQVAMVDTVTEERSCARLAAAAIGDGSIVFFDADDEPSSSGAARGGGAVGGRPGGGASSKKGAAGKGNRSSRPEDVRKASESPPEARALLPGLRISLDAMSGGHTAAASCCCFIPGSLDGDGGDCEREVLGAEEGEGTRREEGAEGLASVASVSGGWHCSDMLLASGGDDRRILLWSIPRAITWSWYLRRRSMMQEQASGDAGASSMPDDPSQSAGVISEDLRWQPPASMHPMVLQTVHKRKVNGMCVSDLPTGMATLGRLLHVADTGRVLTCYHVPSNDMPS